MQKISTINTLFNDLTIQLAGTLLLCYSSYSLLNEGFNPISVLTNKELEPEEKQ